MDVLAALLLDGTVALTRDWVIIFMGLAVGLFFVIALIFVVVLGLLSRLLLKKSIAVLDENVKPTLTSVKASADNVKGTTAFVSQSAVQPIVRTYGVVAGVRRFTSVIAGLTGADTDNARK